MVMKYVQVQDGEEVCIDIQQDFIDAKGIRHPRNILFNWTKRDLWRKLKIKIIDDGDNDVQPEAGT